MVGFYGDPTDPVAITSHKGELYRDENQIYPIAGGRYYIPVSGNVMHFVRQDGKVVSVNRSFAGGTEQVLRKLAAP